MKLSKNFQVSFVNDLSAYATLHPGVENGYLEKAYNEDPIECCEHQNRKREARVVLVECLKCLERYT